MHGTYIFVEEVAREKEGEFTRGTGKYSINTTKSKLYNILQGNKWHIKKKKLARLRVFKEVPGSE